MSRARLRDVVFGLLGAATLLGGVLLADVMFDEVAVSVPEPESRFALPSSEGADPEDPGAILAPVSVPAPDPFFEGATFLAPVIYDPEGNPVPEVAAASSQEGAPSGGGSSAGGSSSEAGPTSPQPQLAPPAAAGSAMATIVRFLDLCAENPAVGCPGGVGATVLFSSPAPQPPPLQIRILPDATMQQYPGLRCDPGWPTRSVIPVVLLSNRPLSRGGGVTLRTGDGKTILDEAPLGPEQLQSSPSEHTLYQNRRYQQTLKGSEPPTGATIGAGYHTCLQVRLDANRAGVATPDRNNNFELTVVGYHDDGIPATKDGAIETLKFTSRYSAARLPLRLTVYDQNRAVVMVPQLADETVSMWISTGNDRSSGPPPSCLSTMPQKVDSGVTQRDASVAPKPYPPNQLDAPDYPWDRSYTHYTLWELDLPSASVHSLCVSWSSGAPTEEWELKTPNGYELEVTAHGLNYFQSRVKGTLLVNIDGASGCFVANPHAVHRPDAPFPDTDLQGTGNAGTYGPMCSTSGSLGSTIELRALFPDGSNEVYGMVSIPTATLREKCVSLWAASGPPCDTSLSWSNPRVLCGGGLTDPDCSEHIWFVLDVSFRLNPRYADRPDPKDWGFNRVWPPP